MNYLGYEFPHESEEEVVATLNGSETYFNRTVAYCTYHHKYLTAKQMKAKNCRGKQCTRYVKTPYSESYWQQIEEKKKAKKLKKMKDGWVNGKYIGGGK